MKTKKIILAGILSLGICSSFNSNAQAFEQEKSYGSVGYGFGNIGNIVLNAYENNEGYNYSSLGPIFLKYEYAISDKFGIGASLVYLSGEAKFTSTNGASNTYNNTISRVGYNAMLRFNWHFGDHDMIDPYFGIAAGYRSNTWSSDFEDPNTEDLEVKTLNHLGLEATFGTRFMFHENLGAYVEVGLARAIFQIGLTGKF
jgi:hypothetical protein